MKRWIAWMLTAALILTGCGQKQEAQPEKNPVPDSTALQEKAWPDAVYIDLSDEQISVDDTAISSDSAQAVYAAHDIVYYEEGRDFTYGEGSESDAHSAEEAAAHTVVHITQPGRYVLSGTLSAGQVAVDLGDDAKENPEAVVTLILNDVDITCTVAPAVIFYNVYECGSTDAETASKDVDTSAAGANVLIADGSTNVVNGSYVARIYKPDSVVLNEDGTEVEDAKKLHKYDAAFYSKMSMNISGEHDADPETAKWGTLCINAENEGLDSELHLTIEGGNINITSGNDGINTNEDGVSVTTINGGVVNIVVSGETGEGDGIDSNGWLVINGGTVIAAACSNSADSGIDSDMGIHINGGSVIASGHMLDRIEDGGQNYAVFNFAEKQSGGTEVTLKGAAGNMATYVPANDFSILLLCDPFLEPGDYTLWQGDTQLDHSGAAGGMMGGGFRSGGMEPGGPRVPPEWEGLDVTELPQIPVEGAGGRRPEGFEPPEGMELPEGDFRPQMNEDGTITLPDGTIMDPAEMKPPAGMGGRPGGFGGMENGESNEVFSISDGGNLFSGVAEMK